MSFYRTYRPQVIVDIDNASVREHLAALLKKDRKDLPHAYLFTGSKGAGKTTAARIIAKLFNCSKPGKNGPCGTCTHCQAIAAGRSLDVIEMDAASNRGIDEMRQLRDRIGLAPTEGGYTVYIIDEVHMLTTEAFNALLKTLEEPPAHAVFILATTNREKVPDTIQSRCITIAFTRADIEELMHALRRIVKAEKINAEDSALKMIAQAADGSFRDAVKYLEQVSFSGEKITDASVQTALSLSDVSTRRKFLDALSAKEAKKAIALVSSVYEDGRDMGAFLTALLGDFHEMLVGIITAKQKANIWTVDMLRDAIRRFTIAYSELRVSPLPQLPLELAIVDFCQAYEPADVPKQGSSNKGNESKNEEMKNEARKETQSESSTVSGLLTMEKLTSHWPDFIAACKPHNHSVAGVLRSSRPRSVDGGIVTLEAFYSFHRDKLSEPKTRQILGDVLKKLFGEKVKVDIVLGKK